MAGGFLFLSYYYPPLKSMGSMRAYYLSHELAKEHQVHVISTENAHRLEQEALPISTDISVQYVPTYDYRTITSKKTSKTHYSEGTKSSLLGRTAVKVLNSFPISSYLGEGGYRYRKAAYRAACQIIDGGGITHIWSSFRPYADHEVAAQLKRKYPHLVWVADYRDIHVDVLKDNVYWRGHQERKAQRLMASADLVTTISQGCLRHLTGIGQRQIVLYNGIPALQQKAGTSTLQHDELQITFTGSLYGHSRDPSLLFRALRSLLDGGHIESSRININYAGKDATKWSSYVTKYQLEHISTVHGMLTYDESLQLQQSSHINLLLTFSHPEVLGAITGKMLEYLQSRKLILCLIKGVKDAEIETFVSTYSHGSTFYADTSSLAPIVDFLLDAYQHTIKADTAYFSHDRSIEKLTWPYLSRQLLREVSAI